MKKKKFVFNFKRIVNLLMPHVYRQMNAKAMKALFVNQENAQKFNHRFISKYIHNIPGMLYTITLT